ncbi:MAG: TVP38/TMEM64 family protein [Anaerolineae bacterium]|nr:TVP38/TMEM64 family protein [Anaerolineae bacterium]
MAAFWGPDLYRLLAQREAVQTWVAGFGAWGPLVSILLNAAQVLLAPIPGQAVGVTNGYLYGVARGTAYSALGVMLGSVVAMALGRWFGRPLVVRLVAAERLAAWDRIAQRQGAAFFFLVFLFPFLPDDVTCFVIGMSALPIPWMMLLSTLGRLPGMVVACWLGAHASVLPGWAWAGMAAAGSALAYLLWHHQERLEQALVGLIRRLVDGAH